jgi:hypothetical protein
VNTRCRGGKVGAFPPGAICSLLQAPPFPEAGVLIEAIRAQPPLQIRLASVANSGLGVVSGASSSAHVDLMSSWPLEVSNRAAGAMG